MNNRIKLGGTTLAILSFTGAASAHTGGALGGIGAGLAHPLMGLDHMLAMLAVGVWASQAPRGNALHGVLAFLSMLAAGFLLGLGGLTSAVVEPGIVGSVMLLGLMLFMRRKVPASLGLAALGVFGLLHGHAHGTEAVGTVGSYMAGFMATSVALHAVGFTIGRRLASIKHAIPALGMSVAAAGLVLAGM